MLKEDMLNLVKAGVVAPSADNMQPWKFNLGEDFLELSLDRKRMGHFFDPAEVATDMGCGALIENIEHYARHLGLQMSIDQESVVERNIVAKLRFSPLTKNDQDDLSGAVFTRCTDRGLYDKKMRVGTRERSLLEESVNEFDDFSLTFYDRPDQQKKIIKTVYQADTIRFNHEKIHEDFYDVLRFGPSAERSKDGLAQSTLGIEFFFIPVLKLLRSWKLTRLLNKLVGLHHMMALRGVWLPMVYSSSLVSIVHTGPADYLQFGRVMERFWLQATDAGLSIQPLGAFPLFLARLNTVAGDGFSDTHIAKLNNLERLFASATPGYRAGEDQLVMLFRVGFARKPPGRSLRRPVESFLL